MNSAFILNSKSLTPHVKGFVCALSIVCCGLVAANVHPRAIAVAQTRNDRLIDWWTDGGDIQRTGWQRHETILTKSNVKNLKILWKIPTGNQVRALHALMPVLVVGQLETANGVRQVGIVNGISDNLYGLD